jgi:hypothetical protein
VTSLNQKRVRTAAAWFCLLAVALLYAPLASAVLLAHGADCCVNGYCNIPAHHHHKQPPAPEKNTVPMDCGHDLGGGMKPCSMSCCQDHLRPALIPGAFVIPSLRAAPAIVGVLYPVQITNSSEISRFVKPLSPPPRFFSAAL